MIYYVCAVVTILLLITLFLTLNITVSYFLELIPDILEQKPTETDGVENVIVVDGLPQVGPDRLPKLQIVINKIFGKFGNITNSYYPTKPNSEETVGYIFLEYANPAYAQEAVKVTNNSKLDKNFTMLVNHLSDFKK